MTDLLSKKYIWAPECRHEIHDADQMHSAKALIRLQAATSGKREIHMYTKNVDKILKDKTKKNIHFYTKALLGYEFQIANKSVSSFQCPAFLVQALHWLDLSCLLFRSLLMCVVLNRCSSWWWQVGCSSAPQMRQAGVRFSFIFYVKFCRCHLDCFLLNVPSTKKPYGDGFGLKSSPESAMVRSQRQK